MLPTYKNIRIKKRGGGTRTQRVQVLASGKYKFVKNKGRSSTKRSTKRKASSKKRRKTKRRRNPMARRKKRNRKKRSFTIPIAVAGGLMAMPAVQASINNALAGQWRNIPQTLAGIVKRPIDNLTPLITGFVIQNSGLALYLDTSNNNTISSNDFNGNNWGMYITSSQYNTIDSNKIHNNTDHAYYSYLASYNIISSNEIYANGDHAIYFHSNDNFNIDICYAVIKCET